MPKRLHMTNADYVAIAVSPALIMALVGSLVFFLIEVLYVGEYPARLVYVFALFVFATVLIARLAIEFGGEHATLFGAPLGILVYLALVRFVEFPSSFSHLINLALMAIVWWWAHKLTVNCTLIDDGEDASGEGLLQQMGVDETTGEVAAATGQSAKVDNELFEKTDQPKQAARPWWRRLLFGNAKSHPPGLWVIYFSLVALPLFGIGQHWIPAEEVGRRRYVFVLLAVYVAAALALLVTTSFLGLRRYLRQRRIEMPAAMAANWVGVGVVVILIVMVLSVLIPRPGAEYSVSQVPWQVGSPDELKSSRFSVGREGVEDEQNPNKVTDDKGPRGEATREGAKGDPAESKQGEASSQPSQNPSQQGDAEKTNAGDPSEDSQSRTQRSENAEQNSKSQSASNSSEQSNQAQQQSQNDQPGNVSTPQHSASDTIKQIPQALSSAVSSLGSVLKLLLYAVLATIIGVLVWRNRSKIVQAIADLWKALRNLIAGIFGGRATASSQEVDAKSAELTQRPRTFAEFRDPFTSGDAGRISPEELVRYTFEAFEAWARDGGCPRSPDQTPAELARAAAPPDTELFDAARRLVRLYSEAAYASGSVSREAAGGLRQLWSQMRATSPKIAAETAAIAR